MWNGAVGNSWKADRNTVKLNPNISAKRGVNSWSDIEHEFSHVRAVLHPPVRQRRIGEREHRVDDRRHGSARAAATLCLEVTRDHTLLCRRPRAQRRSGHPHALPHHQRDVELHLGALRNAICISRPSMTSTSRFRAV